MTEKEIKAYLKEHLKPSRYEHSISVAGEACRLAEIYGADKSKTHLAGLVHDCTKNMPQEEQLKLIAGCKKYTVYDGELENPQLIHALSGAIFAESYFGITDSEILSAVRYHTLGRVNMTLLEKIIYTADLTEPLRVYKGADELRELSYKNIDKAVLKAINNTIAYLKANNAYIQKEIYDIKKSIEETEMN